MRTKSVKMQGLGVLKVPYPGRVPYLAVGLVMGLGPTWAPFPGLQNSPGPAAHSFSSSFQHLFSFLTTCYMSDPAVLTCQSLQRIPSTFQLAS